MSFTEYSNWMEYFAKYPMERIEDRRTWFLAGCTTDLSKYEASDYFPSLRNTSYDTENLFDKETNQLKQSNSSVLDLFIKASHDNNDKEGIEKFTKLREIAVKQEGE